ncbi:hypothetical protein [Mycoplasmopsis columboralis]|uniref:Uncharacterized protein n=1 Tax=Mycoplasmopsis columboralis TaxID=171282 RepID=A0A449B5H5_9BACT|nr:hypothetical protein [Mycoplasmopsis columboralis]VEU75850.1 Uncharacterised protein [Mycoplasmopsis columboralis]
MKYEKNFATDLIDLYCNDKNLNLKLYTWHDKVAKQSFFKLSLPNLPQYFFIVYAPYEESKELNELNKWYFNFVDTENFSSYEINGGKGRFSHLSFELSDVLLKTFLVYLENRTYKNIYSKIMKEYDDFTKWLKSLTVEMVALSERKE